MDLLFSYKQEKKERKSSNTSTCDLKLHFDGTNVIYKGHFSADYKKYGKNKKVHFEHQLGININTGDINIVYQIVNEGLEPEIVLRNVIKNKKNDFKLLEELTDNGFIRGEKKFNYWGVKYNRATNEIFNKIYEILSTKFNSDFLKEKIYKEKFVVNYLYDLVVDFHLDVKKIKGYDFIYNTIKYEYPKKKWLSKNENKYLPAILDSYGIKSKYLISSLNSEKNMMLNISSINYICKLFGENYLDYLKKIPWINFSIEGPPNKKTHQLKNESEKKFMVQLMNKWEKEKAYSDPFVCSINKLLSIREFLEPIGYKLKFNVKTEHEFENLLELWIGHKIHNNRGYKIKYNLPKEFEKFIERPIVINDNVFKPKLLLTEDEFRVEGFLMKNCMGKQFVHGTIYLFASLQYKRRRINLQYKKGELIQSYGKANTKTPGEFDEAILVLTERFKSFKDIEWKKEKFDFLNNK